MIIRKWLIVNENKSARLTSGRPEMRSNEIAISLEVNLPDELFRKPHLEAKITIPKEAAVPDLISTRVVENVQEAIRTATGLEFSVNVVRDDEPEADGLKGILQDDVVRPTGLPPVKMCGTCRLQLAVCRCEKGDLLCDECAGEHRMIGHKVTDLVKE